MPSGLIHKRKLSVQEEQKDEKSKKKKITGDTLCDPLELQELNGNEFIDYNDNLFQNFNFGGFLSGGSEKVEIKNLSVDHEEKKDDVQIHDKEEVSINDKDEISINDKDYISTINNKKDVSFDINTMKKGNRENIDKKDLKLGILLSGNRIKESRKQLGSPSSTKVTDMKLDLVNGYKVQELFGELGIPVNGGNERTGKYPPNKDDKKGRYRTQLAKGKDESGDYSGMRTAQLLSQLSEIAYHSLSDSGVEPVETQFGYGENDKGALDLYASTNNNKSQTKLASLLDDPDAMLKLALDSGSEELQREALKLVFWKEQQGERRSKAKGKLDEKELLEDLDRADKVYDQFFKGGVNVVKNSGSENGKQGRHAEQNIAEVMKGKGYVRKDVQGTKYRCGGCTASIGYGMKSEEGKLLGGNMYSAQATKEDSKEVLSVLSRDEGRIVNASNPTRPRSSSIPKIPVKKEEKN